MAPPAAARGRGAKQHDRASVGLTQMAFITACVFPVICFRTMLVSTHHVAGSTSAKDGATCAEGSSSSGRPDTVAAPHPPPVRLAARPTRSPAFLASPTNGPGSLLGGPQPRASD